MLKKSFLLGFCIITCLLKLNAQNLGEIGKGKAFQLNGNVGFGSTFTLQQGTTARRVPLSWYVNGSPTVKIYNVSIPFSFVWSEQERNFSQPFNKYGASPYYKKLTLHAGWRNLYYSDYTLAGATFLGGGIEWSPKKFRFSAMYGKFRNKVSVSQENQSRFSYLLPSYERWGMGAKIGFGKGPNYTDFIFFRAKDIKDETIAPSADSANIAPMENISVGIKSSYILFKAIDFNADMAVSVVTLDSRIVDSVISNAPEIKPYNRLMTLNSSTRPFLAGNISLGYGKKYFRLKLEYRRVDPEYQTLGSYYIANDLQQYTVSPTFMMFKNRVVLNGSYGIRTNNLLKDQLNTTTSKIGSAFLNINPRPHYGFSFNYSNYGTDLNSGRIQLNDSILFSIVNQSIGGSFRAAKTRGKKTRSFVLNVQIQSLQDNNIVSRANTESNTQVVSTSYNQGNGAKGINFGLGGNYTSVVNNAGVFQLVGPSFNLRKTFSKSKINISCVASFQQKIKKGTTDGNITNVGANLNYTFKKKHTLGLMANALFNRTNNSSSYSYNEQRGSLRYSYNF